MQLKSSWCDRRHWMPQVLHESHYCTMNDEQWISNATSFIKLLESWHGRIDRCLHPFPVYLVWRSVLFGWLLRSTKDLMACRDSGLLAIQIRTQWRKLQDLDWRRQEVNPRVCVQCRPWLHSKRTTVFTDHKSLVDLRIQPHHLQGQTRWIWKAMKTSVKIFSAYVVNFEADL